jgi:multidrug efflux pump subunit AcrA (membrane-fusion protein)
MNHKIEHIMSAISSSLKNALRKVYHTVDDHPLQYFFGLMGVVMFFIVLTFVIQTPKTKVAVEEKKAKTVEIFSIGKAPRISMQGKVEKSGVIKITALTGGVVQNIYKHEGDKVNRGVWMFGLSTNYQGAVSQSVSRQIAEKNLQFLTDTYDAQKDVITKNKDTANKAEAQASILRDISYKSIEETNNLIKLNDSILSMMDDQLSALDAINVNGSSNSAIMSLKQGKSQIVATLNQAHASVRAAEYQTNGDNEPGAIARNQRDATLRQLEIQEKSLDLNREIAQLNVRLAQIQESLMYPSAPFNGTVERINVKVGQNVTAGTVLATLTGAQNTATITVLTSRNIATSISRIEPSVITIGDKDIQMYPSYVSSEPTDGTLHTVFFNLPEEYGANFSNDQVILVDMPIGTAQSSAAVPFIPLDAIYQTDTESYVYVVRAEKGVTKAASLKVTLGEVMGDYVEVKNGLTSGDRIILDRNVIEGDVVSVRTY